MSNTTPNPLARMVEAQKIILAAMKPCADARAALCALADLLCGAEANHELLAAGAFDDSLGGRRAAALAAA